MKKTDKELQTNILAEVFSVQSKYSPSHAQKIYSNSQAYNDMISV